ncbi:MAG: hypothetical protein ACJ0BK_00220 [Coraliomargaritaceae bacterium]
MIDKALVAGRGSQKSLTEGASPGRPFLRIAFFLPDNLPLIRLHFPSRINRLMGQSGSVHEKSFLLF